MIDLRDCEPGDQLVSKHGLLLEYIRPLPEDRYMDHEVKYPNISPYFGSSGTRTHNGQVMRKERLDTDHDIVEIIKKK